MTVGKITFKKFHKDFKIGEASYYGIWRLEGNGRKLKVIGMDWYTRIVEEEREFDTFGSSFWTDLYKYLKDRSTSGWADEMMGYARKKVKGPN